MEPTDVYDLLNTVLELNYEVIGLKLLATEEDFLKENANEVIKPIRYCVMVKSAALGNSIKIKGSQFKCNGSGISFGYWKTDEEYLSGRHPFKTGLHKSVDVSKDIVNSMYRLQGESFGLTIKPLNQFSDNPDCILIIANPYAAMRLSQGYTYKFGLKKDFNIAGNQAVCYEASVVPMVEEGMNISMLCAGTRHAANWEDNDLIVGISSKIINDIVEGVIQTINTVEPDAKKQQIIKKNESSKILDTEISLGSAYFYSGTFVTS